MSLADVTLAALRGFATEVSTWTNQGSLTSIGDHIAQIENAATQDVHAAETAAKAVWAELYGAFHGHAPTPLTPADPAHAAVAEPPAPVVAPAPAEPVAADPTPAPSTTTEDSSAPSSTPSDSTTPGADTASAA